MKKLFLILGAASALALAGCNQGGTSDEYDTSSGTGSNSIQSGNNASTGGANNSGTGSHSTDAGNQ